MGRVDFAPGIALPPMRGFSLLPPVPVFLGEEEAEVDGFAICPVGGFFVSGVLAGPDFC